MIREIAINHGPSVKTLIEAYWRLMDSIQYRKYKVDPARSVLETGDTVRPETVIGFHHETGRPVAAEVEGQVVRIMINPLDESVMMLAVCREDD
jgi:hypothetical protein